VIHRVAFRKAVLAGVIGALTWEAGIRALILLHCAPWLGTWLSGRGSEMLNGMILRYLEATAWPLAPSTARAYACERQFRNKGHHGLTHFGSLAHC
jgi:hypothetical protein